MASRRKRNAQGSVTKNEEDLASMVQSGPTGAYEALQLYRSRAIRLKNKNDVNGALKSCTSGTVLLLENGYENAGAELGEVLVELLAETNQPVSEEIKSMIFAIADKFPSTPKAPVTSTVSTGSAATASTTTSGTTTNTNSTLGQSTHNHKIEFLKSCIKWSAEYGTKDLGDPSIHTKLALCLWEMNDKNAANHFALGEAPLLYNDKLFEKFPTNTSEDTIQRDRALTIGIVHFLSMENLRDAFDLFTAYKKTLVAKGFHESMNIPPSSELLMFCDYLLQVSRRDAQALFKHIVNAYASVVDFDDSVPTLLMGPIAAKLFGIKPKVNPMMSMLQSMMST
jgi:hypothetical protein